MRVAVLADTHLQRLRLRQLLQQRGYRILMNEDPSRLATADLEDCQPDAWLVSLNSMDEDARLELLDYLYQQEQPVLYGEGEAPAVGSEDFPRWQRTVLKKLRAALPEKAQPSSPPPAQQPAGVSGARPKPVEQVWLLVASQGGPVAVKEFLEHLPHDLPLGLLYAQHIDPRFEKYLPRVVGRHSNWKVHPVRDGLPVQKGEMLVVPQCQAIAFADDGRVECLSDRWPDEAGPCFERLLHDLGRQFGPASGMIVFSGMGSIGKAACLRAGGQGVSIWTQSSQSSICTQMADSVREGGFSSYSAAPRELARRLASHLQHQRTGTDRAQGAEHVGPCGN